MNKMIKMTWSEIPAVGQNLLLTVVASEFHLIPQTKKQEAINNPESNRHKRV